MMRWREGAKLLGAPQTVGRAWAGILDGFLSSGQSGGMIPTPGVIQEENHGFMENHGRGEAQLQPPCTALPSLQMDFSILWAWPLWWRGS